MSRVAGLLFNIFSLLFFCVLAQCAAAGYVKEPLACKLYKDIYFPGFPDVKLSFEYYHHFKLKETTFYFNTDKLSTQIYVTSLHILPVKQVNLSKIDHINLELWSSSLWKSATNDKNIFVYIPVVDWFRSNDHFNNIDDIYIDQQFIEHVNISEQLDNNEMIIKMNVEGIFPEDPWWFDIEICFSAVIYYN